MPISQFLGRSNRKYDTSLIRKTTALLKGNNDGEISLSDMQVLWEHAHNSGNTDEVLQDTFDFILRNRPVHPSAAEWFRSKPPFTASLDERIKAILHGRYGLENLRWTIPADEVDRQQALNNRQSFEEALAQAVYAILFDVAPLDRLPKYQTDINWYDPLIRLGQMRAFLNAEDQQTVIELIPLDFPDSLVFEMPYEAQADELLNPADFWTFKIKSDSNWSYQFVAQVRRADADQVNAYAVAFNIYNRQEEMIRYLLQRELGLEGITWNMDPVEIGRQMALEQPLTFIPALRRAMDSFLKDDEGGLRSIVRLHAYTPEPEAFLSPEGFEDWLDALVRLHLRECIIRLMPLDLDDYVNGFTAPEGDESASDNWIFQLEIPRWADYNFWAVVDRKGEVAAFNYHFN